MLPKSSVMHTKYKLASLAFRALSGLVPDYPAGDCQLVALSGRRPLRSAERCLCMYHIRTAPSVTVPSLPPARAHGTSCRSAYVTLTQGYHWLPSTNIWKHTCSPSRFETTAHLWHLWFICAVYKFTYLLTYKSCIIVVFYDRNPEKREAKVTAVWETHSCH